MPNHVANEIIFSDADDTQIAAIKNAVLDIQGKIDFTRLLPIPLYCWMGDVGSFHEKTFPDTALAWCSKHWGTKWNAYGDYSGSEIIDGHLILRFESAWEAPYGWLAALMNTFHISFSHAHLSEGGFVARIGQFVVSPKGQHDWDESDAPEALARHLHKLLWGVEEFTEEKA